MQESSRHSMQVNVFADYLVALARIKMRIKLQQTRYLCYHVSATIYQIVRWMNLAIGQTIERRLTGDNYNTLA